MAIELPCLILSIVVVDWESCSEEEEEEDSDGSWIDVYHSSDEEQEKVTIMRNSSC